MKVMILICSVLFISTAFAERKISSTIPFETIERLKKLYPEQTEAFLFKRLANAPTAFQRWRSFPPYYYEMLTRIKKSKLLNSRTGLCAGDAHLENVGFIYSDKPLFTLNDLDDVAPCSLDADAMRLLIGQRLVTPISTADFYKAYLEGLSGDGHSYPDYLLELERKSVKSNTGMPKKYKKLFETKTCKGDFTPLTKNELRTIQSFVDSEDKKFLKACSRIKDSGGSAGSKRFIVFHKTKQGTDVFELKPLLLPAPLFDKTLSLKERELIFEHALKIYFTPSLKVHYYAVTLGEQLYQRRPIWEGNTKIKGDELTSKELQQVMLYQAKTLGHYHRVSNTSSMQLSAEVFNKLTLEIEQQWKLEFAE